MSPLFRERLLVSLAPGEVSWVRLGGIFKPMARDKRVISIDHGYGTRPWDSAIAALRTEAATWRNAKLAVHAVLSNHFVRYALMPHSDGVRSGEEEQALARFHFSKVHGDISREWDIRLSPMHAGGTRLACAVDTALIAALRQSFPSGQQTRLASVQPLLMSVFNSSNAIVPDAGAWLVMAEQDRTCIALLSRNTWHTVQNVNGQFSDADAWISLVERERWRVNFDTVPETILVHAAYAAALPSRTHGTWKVRELNPRWPDGLLPSRDGAYATALSAA